MAPDAVPASLSQLALAADLESYRLNSAASYLSSCSDTDLYLSQPQLRVHPDAVVTTSKSIT